MWPSVILWKSDIGEAFLLLLFYSFIFIFVFLWMNFWSGKDLILLLLLWYFYEWTSGLERIWPKESWYLWYISKSPYLEGFLFFFFPSSFFIFFSIFAFFFLIFFVFPSLLGWGIFDLKEFDTLYFLFSNLHLIFISKGQLFGGIFIFLPLFKF